MRRFGVWVLVATGVSAQAAWQGGSLAIVQLGDGVSAVSSSAAQVHLVELDKLTGALTGTNANLSYAGPTGIGIAGNTTAEAGLNIQGMEAVIGGYQVAPGSSTSGADRRVVKFNLSAGSFTAQADLPFTSFTAAIRDASPFGEEGFALATVQGCQVGTFGFGTASSVSGSDTNVRFVSPNHGLYAYSISSSGNYCVKEIGSSNVLLNVTSAVIIVADHAITTDGLTLYLASDSTSEGGLWRFSRPSTASPFSVPGVRVFNQPLRHITLHEAGAGDQVFATYKSGTSSWAYGFLSANTASAGTSPDWTTPAPTNTTFAGISVTQAEPSVSGTVSLLNWVGAVEGQEITLTIKPAGSTDTAFQGTAHVGSGGAFTLALPSGFAQGTYDVYADRTLFLRRKVTSLAIGASGATG